MKGLKMEKVENGRSMIEMMMVLALIGILTIGSIKAYQSGNDQNEANKIHELVSIASLNALTKMTLLSDDNSGCSPKQFKDFDNTCKNGKNIWNTIGKQQADYKCVSSLKARVITDTAGIKSQIQITFSGGCDEIKSMLTSQWGSSHWDDGSNTYTPPRDGE